MSSLTACGTSLVRALVIAALATCMAYPVRALLARTGSRLARRVAWGLLLAPFLTPALLVGYAYYSFAFSMVHNPALNQLLYLALVTMKLVPVAVLLVMFAPAPPLTAEAVFVHGLLKSISSPSPSGRGWPVHRPGEGVGNQRVINPSWNSSQELANSSSHALTRREYTPPSPGGRGGRWTRLGMISRGPARVGATAFALTFLLAFQEFEMASLMAIRTWSVWLFDAQAGGLALGRSLFYGLPPFVCEVVVLLPVAALLLGGRRPRATVGSGVVRTRASFWRSVAVWCYLVGAVVVMTLTPAVTLLISAMTGFRGLFENFPIAEQLRASLLFSAGAALASYLAARWLTSLTGRRTLGRLRISILAVLAAPGLLGPLLVALSLLCFFQLPVLSHVYDTPLPLLICMTLLQIAPAALLVVLFNVLSSAEAGHSARLMLASSLGRQRRSGRGLLWDLRVQPQLWVYFLLFCLGFFDLTSASLLSPSALTPATVYLFNLMHYGRNAALSAMVCMTVGIPVMLLAVTATGRWWGAWMGKLSAVFWG